MTHPAHDICAISFMRLLNKVKQTSLPGAMTSFQIILHHWRDKSQKRDRKFNPFRCLHRWTTSKKLGKCLHDSDIKALLFSTLMKNPLMFGIYQVSKIKFSCPVILISANPVKPAGSCYGSGRYLHLHSFYQITCRERSGRHGRASGEGGVSTRLWRSLTSQRG